MSDISFRGGGFRIELKLWIENFINYKLKLEGGTIHVPRDQRICHLFGIEIMEMNIIIL
jgi:hypothetical protein